jgi:N-methylhydantoinase A
VPVYSRSDLAPGTALAGPGLIVEDQTTTFIPERFAARISGGGHIVAEIRGETAR